MRQEHKTERVNEAIAKVKNIVDAENFTLYDFWTPAECQDLEEYLHTFIDSRALEYPQLITVTTMDRISRLGKRIVSNDAFTLSYNAGLEGLVVYVHLDYLDR